MLKLLFCIVIFSIFSFEVCGSSAKIDLESDGLTYETRENSYNQIELVSVYKNDKLLGTYDNLVVDTLSVSSVLVSVAKGGIAILIESNGSRNHYSILAPIVLINGKLYVECLYKNVYDTIERAV